MAIPTEPIGSIPRPKELIEAMKALGEGSISRGDFDKKAVEAVKETIMQFEATGSPVISDGEQTKPSFATYPVDGLDNIAPGGVIIPFSDDHTRQLPVLVKGPFRYKTYADSYLTTAKQFTMKPVKQAVISASAMSLLYPGDVIEGYSREEFLDDLVNEAEKDIRQCIENGAYKVQIDFTEGRLAVKLDPSRGLLQQFIDLNNRVLERFTDKERRIIGVHTCPGGDLDATHSADVDYAELLPLLFKLKAGNFYIQLASENDREKVLKSIKKHGTGDYMIFVGVIDPINPKKETPGDVMEQVLEAAEFISTERLGTTDDCGFSPFGDDTSTARETAFAKIRARVEGTAMAAEKLGI